MFHTVITLLMSLFMSCSLSQPFSSINKEIEEMAITDSYTITYVLNGGTLSGFANPEVVEIGTMHILPTIANINKENFDFAGWYKDATFTTPRYTRLSAMHNEDVALYAKYTPSIPLSVTHNITYLLNGGSFVGTPNNTEYIEGIDYVLPTNNVTKEGYQFKGWYLEDNVTKVEVINGIFTNDLILSALYEEIKIDEEVEDKIFSYGKEYKIHYNLNGGTLNESDYPLSYIAGVGCLLPTTVNKVNYDFIGWSTRNLSGVIITSISNHHYGDVYLKANYNLSSNAKKYTITYINNGGIINEEYKETYLDEEVILPTKVCLAHATFDGWYESNDFSGNRVYKISNIDIGNKVFYAKFVYEIYSIIYYLDSGVINEQYVTSYHAGEEIILPTNISLVGFRFLGFSENKDDSTNLVTKINKNDFGTKIYYAIYESTSANLIYLWILLPVIVVLMSGGIGLYIHMRQKEL